MGMNPTQHQTEFAQAFVSQHFIPKVKVKVGGYVERHKALDLFLSNTHGRFTKETNCRISMERKDIIFCTRAVLKLTKTYNKKIQ